MMRGLELGVSIFIIAVYTPWTGAAAAAGARNQPQPKRLVYATVSTLNGTSPRFPCNGPELALRGSASGTGEVSGGRHRRVDAQAEATLVFAPRGNTVVELHRTNVTPTSEATCWISGMVIAGEYVVRSADRNGTVGGAIIDLVFKAIDLARPIQNLGNQTLPFMATSWTATNPLDGDSVAGLWQPSNYATEAGAASCETTVVATPQGVQLPKGCGLSTRSLEARTLNVFRHPLSVIVEGVHVGRGATAYVGLEVPSAAEVTVTGWPAVRHYLPLMPPSTGVDLHGVAATPPGTGVDTALSDSDDTTTNATPPAADGQCPPSIAVTVSDAGVVQLWRRRIRNTSAELLGTAQAKAGCGAETPARVELWAGSMVPTSKSVLRKAPPLAVWVLVSCENQPSINITGELGLDFLDASGFGETVGEAVLAIRALPADDNRSSTTTSVTFGTVSVANQLDPGFPPGVLAPLTDTNGVINWDHGALGVWHDTAEVTRGAVGPRDGVLDVTNPPFSADNTGVTDATEALQAAIDFCRDNYLSPWLPAGQYMVTKSIRLIQLPRLASIGSSELNLTSNYCPQRFTTWALRGEVAGSDSSPRLVPVAGSPFRARHGRATLVVPPNTPAFGVRDGAMNTSVPVAVLNCSCINAEGHLEPNVLMAMVVQSIDVVIGSGNPTAVGVRMRGAQGSSLEDVAVLAAPDAFAGISGVSGSGGAHSNLTVIGARIGIDARDTQPSATLSNIRLINQSCTALIHMGLETLTIAGVHVVVGSAAEPGAPAFTTGVPGLPLPGLPNHGRCHSLLSPATNVPTSTLISGALSVVDAGFECVECLGNRAAVAASRNVYLRHATVVGLISIAQMYAATAADRVIYSLPTNASEEGGIDVRELSIPVAVAVPTINSTAVLNGEIMTPRQANGPVIFDWTSTGPKPPGFFDQRCDRHGWGDNAAFPTVAGTSHTMVNPRNHGAIGDGVHDDTEALQTAVTAAAAAAVPLFLPRGVFRTCASIVLPRGMQILGLARHLVQLVATDEGFGTCAGDVEKMKRLQHLRSSSLAAGGGGDGDEPEPNYDTVAPILLFSDRAARTTLPSARSAPVGKLSSLLFGVTLFVPTVNTKSNASHWAFYAGVSAADRFNVYRQSWQTRRPVCGEWWGDGCARRRIAQIPYTHAYARIEGPVATVRVFAFFQEDGVANNEIQSQSPFSRKLLVNGTRKAIDIYQLNGEHSVSTAYAEFDNTSGVAIYGCKSESSQSLSAVIVVRGSNNFSSYGHGGAAHVSDSPIGPESCNAMSPCPWVTSLYRVLDSDNVRFVNLQGQFFSAQSSMMYEVHDATNVSARKGDWPALWFRTPVP